MSEPYYGKSDNPDTAGLLGEGGTGVYGRNITPHGHGVIGYSDDGRGIWGHTKTGVGVVGESTLGEGMRGVSHSSNGGVVGINDAALPGGNGGWFESTLGEGVRGVSHNAHGAVVGVNDAPLPGGNGGWFESSLGEGVRGWSKNANHGAVVGVNTGGGIGVYGEGPIAGYFKGDVEVTGDIRLTNADCAEDFDMCDAAKVEPGTVMVLGIEGALAESQQAYDKRVAGVISGAGDYKPGIVLDKQQTQGNRQPIALMGKVFCKVDANYGAIEVGDLLTTSPTPGHAMKTSDPLKAFGAVIGKALRPLTDGQGLIPILIALQ